MTTTTLFDRCWKIRVGELVFDSKAATPIHIEFEVTKTLYVMANTAKLTVSNLNAEHREQFARLRHAATRTGRRRIRVEIHAGYGSDPALLFVGDVRGFIDEQNGTETITTFEGSDGGPLITEQRFSRTYRAGTNVTTPIREMVEALSIGEGNLREINAIQLGPYQTLPRPKTFHGLVSKSLTDYLASLGFRWSIQNGAVQILRNGATLARTGVRLTRETGLIEAHYVDWRTVHIQSFLIPELAPGYRIIVESERVNGDFRVHSVKYGGAWDGDWTAEVECVIPRPLTPY